MSSTTGPATTGPATTGPASPPARAAAVRVGMFAPFGLLEQGPEAARAFLADVGQAGIDHICCGDHVSFGGAGFDGLVQATALAMLHPALPVYCGVYLLPRRHPVLVARQLADLGRIAPGRLVFGVGIGGEDRREVSICGVDPATPRSADERVPARRTPAADRRADLVQRQVLRYRRSGHGAGGRMGGM